MKNIEEIIQLAFRESQKDLFNFIKENYGKNDPELTFDNLTKMFPLDEIQITNDKFMENKGRGRPRKNSNQI